MALTVNINRIANTPAFRTNTFTGGNQDLPDVLGLSNGGFVAAYNTHNAGAPFVLLNFYDANFNPLGGFDTAYSGTSFAVGQPSLTALGNGNVLVAWDEDHGEAPGPGLRGRLFTPDGTPVGGELDLNPGQYSTFIGDPQIAALSGGGFVLSSKSATSADHDIHFHRYDNAGNELGGFVLANTVATTGVQEDSAVAALAGGGFAITWTDTNPADQTIRAAIFNTDGSIRKADFVVGAFGDNTQSKVAALPNGNWAVVYRDTGWGGAEAGSSGITLQIFNAAGANVTPGSFIHVNTPGTGNESAPDLTVLPNGFIVVTWSPQPTLSPDPIMARVYDQGGNPITINSDPDEFVLVVSGTDDTSSAVSRILAGRFVTAWHDEENDGSGGQITSIVTELTRAVFGDGAHDIFTGDQLRDSVDGGGGNDVLNGAGGNDLLTGGAGDDRFIHAPGGGQDVVVDLAAGAGSPDRIDLTAFGNINALGDVLARAEQFGANTRIDLDNGDRLTLVDVQKADLSHADFVELAARPTNDFSGEGRADILWRHSNGTSNVFTMNGAQVQGGSNTTLQVDNNWAAQDKNDFNGDGRADILWRHQNGTSNIFLMDGAQVIGGSNTSLQVDNDWTVQDTGDFNGDGRADILWRHLNGTSNIFLMDGATVVGGSNTTVQVDNAWTVQGTGDFDGDGRADILWRHANGTANVFTMNGAAVIGGSNTTLQVDNNWTVQGVADFNGDGRADILWRHANGTANVFLMNGATVVGDGNLSQQVDASWTVQDTGDYNGDGRADILWRHANGTTNVFLIDGTTVIGGSNTSLQIGNDWHVV